MAFNEQAFKADYLQHGADDLRVQLLHLRTLAKLYKKKAFNQPHTKDRWLTYVKAHGLINACLFRCSQQEVPVLEQQLYELESHWYGGTHPLKDLQEWRELTNKHQRQLKDIRHDCLERFKVCGRISEKIDTDDLSSGTNKQTFEEFAVAVQQQSLHCTEQMKKFAKVICESSENMLKARGEAPPCAYAVIALGSIARGEATPYSDLEYAFIVKESGHDEYFTKLAVDTYFRLSNLKETPLKSLYIQELLSCKRWFNDSCVCGFRIDGLTPSSGNIPTGNGLKESLTFTVEEMVERYTQSINATATKGLIGSMADMLSSIETVHFDSSEGEDLVNEFLCEKVAIDSVMSKVESSIGTIIQDVKRHSEDFAPKDLQVDMRSLKIKMHIFRYTTILALDLKVALGLDGQTAWDIYNELCSKTIISKAFLESVLFVLTAAIWIRTTAYLQTGSQQDIIAFHPAFDSQAPNDRFYAPKKLYIAMASQLVPMKRNILRTVENQTGPQSVDTLKDVLGNLRSEVADFSEQARLHYTCGDYRGGLHHLHVSLSDAHITDDVERFIQRVGADNDLLLLTAYLLFHDCQFSKALGYFKHLYKLEKDGANDSIKLASLHVSIGQCLVMAAHYNDSRKEFDDAGRCIRSYFNIRGLSDIPLLLTRLPTFVNEQREKIVLYCCLNANFLSISVKYHQGRHHKTREAFQKLTNSFLLLQMIMAPDDNPECNAIIGDLNMSIGLYHIQFAEYKQADSCLKKALRIYGNVYGKLSASNTMSLIHHSLSDLELRRANFNKAERLGKLSLDILQKSRQKNMPQLIACHQMLAEVYLEMGNYSESLAQIQICLDITNNPEMEGFMLTEAVCKVIEAHVKQQEMKHTQTQHLTSLKQLKESVSEDLKVIQNLVDKKVMETHPFVSKSRQVLAEICLDLNRPEEALNLAKKALEGSLAAHGYEHPHPDIITSKLIKAQAHLYLHELQLSHSSLSDVMADCDKLYGRQCNHPYVAQALHILSKLEAVQGNYLPAWQHAANSLNMQKNIHGENSTAPFIQTYEHQQGLMFALFQSGSCQLS